VRQGLKFVTRRNQRNKKWVWIVAVVGSIALIAGVWGLANWLVDPGDPSAFYDAPQPLLDGPPGTLIRSESLGGANVAARRPTASSTRRRVWVTGRSRCRRRRRPPTPEACARNAPIVAWAHGTSGIT
jgi:hypothetical protein